ncbi:ribonuclease R [Candidatus Hoaglandella endobia]|uniref:Ribonuclease R n=1 Tax=Candidatus Hoaglandella endobia TaxID=1778263 RepID=A0A143WU54_9ENTR|nr:ribonuclease R [Candidatus Hoaglandella endobia]CUX97389.1 Ribonuclease R [Candidatus Hoaglandella endobia]
MSQDPFIEREAEKYTLPVPSREFILNHLAKRENPVSRKELAQELDISGEDQLEGLRRRLRAMERDGQLIYTSRQCYVLPKMRDLLRGTVIGHRDGFGFLRIEGSKNDYYLSIEQMNLAIHGDIVLAHTHGSDRKGRREARIIRVLVPQTSKIVGHFFTAAGSAFVVPEDSRLSFDIFIPPEATQGAYMGFVVVVELIQRPTRRTKAIGKVVEVLGNNIDTNMVINIALRTHNIPYVWPQEVEQQLASLQKEIPKITKSERVDLRTLPLMTIDGEDALDFDDAIYCEKNRSGGWRLWVAIADVSYYVRSNTPLDQEASRRAMSVYFPSQVVIPMLPEVLSNDLCSLNPQVDRLCMVCEMTISAHGRLSSYKFYEAVINSHARLTYSRVWDILQGKNDLCAYEASIEASIIKALKQLHEMYKILKQDRLRRGGICFETEEAKFIFNTERRIERIESVKSNDAHRIIEECMILANIAAARFVEKKREPALYRVHDRPSNNHLMSLRTVLGQLGLSLDGGDKPEPKDYAKIMNIIAGRSDYEMLQTMLLRSMKQAIYDPENRGHFGLALQVYGHFTSPIRRYPDLVLHRAIKYLLYRKNHKNNNEVEVRATPNGGWHYELEELLQLGQQCSLSERRADDATRDVSDWLKCDFMQDYLGKIFSGIITSVTSFGFFVRLNKLFIDGLVHVSSLDNDYYRYDNIGQRIIGESSGRVYQLGDAVVIRIEAVHMDERKIDFFVISDRFQQRCFGKTIRQHQQQNTHSGNKDKKNVAATTSAYQR